MLLTTIRGASAELANGTAGHTQNLTLKELVGDEKSVKPQAVFVVRQSQPKALDGTARAGLRRGSWRQGDEVCE